MSVYARPYDDDAARICSRPAHTHLHTHPHTHTHTQAHRPPAGLSHNLSYNTRLWLLYFIRTTNFKLIYASNPNSSSWILVFKIFWYVSRTRSQLGCESRGPARGRNVVGVTATCPDVKQATHTSHTVRIGSRAFPFFLLYELYMRASVPHISHRKKNAAHTPVRALAD